MDDSNSQEISISEQINPIFNLIEIPLNPKIVSNYNQHYYSSFFRVLLDLHLNPNQYNTRIKIVEEENPNSNLWMKLYTHIYFKNENKFNLGEAVYRFLIYLAKITYFNLK